MLLIGQVFFLYKTLKLLPKSMFLGPLYGRILKFKSIDDFKNMYKKKTQFSEAIVRVIIIEAKPLV